MTKKYSPLSQTFTIDSTLYPNGVVLRSIIVYFRKKDNIHPITIDVRPTVNGYPDNTIVYSNSKVTLYPEEIKIRTGGEDDLPVADDYNSQTYFTFPAPLCLMPGNHAFVFTTNSLEYELFTSVLGETSLVTSQSVASANDFTGNMFKSSNSSAYIAEPAANLMYQIIINRYNTSEFGLVQYDSYDENAATTGIFRYSTFEVTKSDAVPGKTNVGYFYSTTSATNGLYTHKLEDWIPCGVNTNNTLYSEKGATGSTVLDLFTPSFSLLSSLKTTDPYVTPIVSDNSSSVVFVKNKINYGLTDSNNFLLSNNGAGYGPKIVITGTNTTPAVAGAIVENGVITKIVIYDGGTGYVTPSVSIEGTSGTGAQIGTVVVEDGIITEINLDYDAETLEQLGGSGYGPVFTFSGPDLPDGDQLTIEPIIGLDPGIDQYNPASDIMIQSQSMIGKITGFRNIPALGYINKPTITVDHNKARATVTLNAGAVDSIAVDYGGFDYADADLTIVGDGTGATASATIVDGVITAITVDTPGSGYTYANVVISSTSDAVISPTGFENQQSGNIAEAKYITKQITLDNPADRIQIIMDVNRPKDTELAVYVKVHNSEDGDMFDQKEWFEVEFDDGITQFPLSTNTYDFSEVKLKLKDIKYETANGLFVGFNKFSIKIVMLSKDACIVPKIRNFRALALK